MSAACSHGGTPGVKAASSSINIPCSGLRQRTAPLRAISSICGRTAHPRPNVIMTLFRPMPLVFPLFAEIETSSATLSPFHAPNEYPSSVIGCRLSSRRFSFSSDAISSRSIGVFEPLRDRPFRYQCCSCGSICCIDCRRSRTIAALSEREVGPCCQYMPISGRNAHLLRVIYDANLRSLAVRSFWVTAAPKGSEKRHSIW